MKRNKVQCHKGFGMATFIRRYATDGQCAYILFKVRWPHGSLCPGCSCKRH